jgi:hypothetical protein
MLTKIGMTLLAGAMATTALAGTASANEVRVVAPPPPGVMMMNRPVASRFDRNGLERDRQARFERERQGRREEERRASLERDRQARLERERQARLERDRRQHQRQSWQHLEHHADGRGYNR